MANKYGQTTLTMQLQDIDKSQLRTACASKDALTGLAEDVWWMPEPSVTRAWFKAVGLHSFPTVNANGGALTYATLERSQYSAVGQQINIEHGLKPTSINANGSPIAIGSIDRLWMPWYEEGEDKVRPSAPIPVYLLAGLWRKQAKEIIADLKQPDLAGWSVSMEVRFTDSDVYWKDQFWTYDEKPELFDRINQVVDGSLVVQIYGGRDGFVEWQGFGMVKNPAYKTAKILQVVATNHGEAMFNGGIVLLDYKDDITPPKVVGQNGGPDDMELTKEIMEFINSAKAEAVAAAKVQWEAEKLAAITEAKASVVGEKDAAIANLTAENTQLKADKDVLETAKASLQTEVDTFKLAAKSAERMAALASVKIPQTLSESVSAKAKSLDDTAWAAYVEELKAWSAVVPATASASAFVPIVPEGGNAGSGVAADTQTGASFVASDGNTYFYADLFKTAPKA